MLVAVETLFLVLVDEGRSVGDDFKLGLWKSSEGLLVEAEAFEFAAPFCIMADALRFRGIDLLALWLKEFLLWPKMLLPEPVVEE